MAVQNARPSPFNTLTSDADWEMLTSGVGLGDGVNLGSSSGLAPSLDTGGRNIDIAAGNCQIKGKVWSCDATVATAIPAASGQDRIDRLTMRLLRTAGTAATFIQPNLIQGTPGGSPVIPAITQTTTGIWDLPICHWTSKSTGALTSLVDERFDSGKTVHFGPSGNMPTWFTRPTLYYQTDTNLMYVWNNTSWSLLSPQAGAWLNFPGSMQNGWNIGGHAQYRLTVNGDLQVSLKDLQPGSVSDGTPLWNANAITSGSGCQVNNAHRVVAYSDGIKTVGGNLEMSCIEFEADGSVQCFGIASGATRLDCYATVPIA